MLEVTLTPLFYLCNNSIETGFIHVAETLKKDRLVHFKKVKINDEGVGTIMVSFGLTASTLLRNISYCEIIYNALFFTTTA